MTHDRPPDSGGEFTDSHKTQPGTAPAAPPSGEISASEDARARAAWHGFTVQPGGRSAMMSAAERIGGAMGGAQRKMRHGLELVSSAQGKITQAVAEAVAGDSEEPAPAALRLEAIEEEIAEAGRQTAQALEELGEAASESLQRMSARMTDALSHLRPARTEAGYPPESIATPLIAGFCIAFGVALLIRGAHSR